VDFYYDQNIGQRIFYSRASHRPLRARQSPAPVPGPAVNGQRRQPTAEEPKTLGAVVRGAIIDAIMDQHPAICRQLVREAIGVGIERAVDNARGIRR